MTLRQYMVFRGWAREESSRKCFCPFHSDNSPSAYLNDNTIYCFACNKTFKLYDFKREFGVRLDYVKTSSLLEGMHQFNPITSDVLFTYPWHKEAK